MPSGDKSSASHLEGGGRHEADEVMKQNNQLYKLLFGSLEEGGYAAPTEEQMKKHNEECKDMDAYLRPSFQVAQKIRRAFERECMHELPETLPPFRIVGSLVILGILKESEASQLANCVWQQVTGNLDNAKDQGVSKSLVFAAFYKVWKELCKHAVTGARSYADRMRVTLRADFMYAIRNEVEKRKDADAFDRKIQQLQDKLKTVNDAAAAERQRKIKDVEERIAQGGGGLAPALKRGKKSFTCLKWLKSECKCGVSGKDCKDDHFCTLSTATFLNKRFDLGLSDEQLKAKAKQNE